MLASVREREQAVVWRMGELDAYAFSPLRKPRAEDDETRATDDEYRGLTSTGCRSSVYV
jgi:hypothetical protein